MLLNLFRYRYLLSPLSTAVSLSNFLLIMLDFLLVCEILVVEGLTHEFSRILFLNRIKFKSSWIHHLARHLRWFSSGMCLLDTFVVQSNKRLLFILNTRKWVNSILIQGFVIVIVCWRIDCLSYYRSIIVGGKVLPLSIINLLGIY